MAEMYAAVDLSKKRKNMGQTRTEAESTVDTPMYTPIDISKRTLENSEDYAKLSSSRLDTGHRQSPAATNNHKFSLKIIVLLVITAIAILLCLSFIIMFAVVFVKVSALELMVSSIETNTAVATSSANQTSSELPQHPGSCLDVVTPNVMKLSGYYILRTSTGKIVNGYCDTTRVCNGVGGGWMRVAKLDVDSCPPTLMPKSYRSGAFQTCVSIEDAGGCTSIFYHTFDVPYSQVCGQVRGYQVGTPDGLRGERVVLDIDSNYLDGISITVNRRHVWSFFAGNCVGANTTLSTLANNWTCDKTNICPAGILCGHFFGTTSNGTVQCLGLGMTCRRALLQILKFAFVEMKRER